MTCTGRTWRDGQKISLPPHNWPPGQTGHNTNLLWIWVHTKPIMGGKLLDGPYICHCLSFLILQMHLKTKESMKPD